MFGFKIISKQRYKELVESESKWQEKVNAWESAAIKNDKDIESLREQNAKLRSINGKRKDENDNLIEKNRKLKEQVKQKQDIKFEKYFTLCTPESCDTCTHEQKDCKKFYLERETDVVCVCPKPSFRKK